MEVSGHRGMLTTTIVMVVVGDGCAARAYREVCATGGSCQEIDVGEGKCGLLRFRHRRGGGAVQGRGVGGECKRARHGGGLEPLYLPTNKWIMDPNSISEKT